MSNNRKGGRDGLQFQGVQSGSGISAAAKHPGVVAGRRFGLVHHRCGGPDGFRGFLSEVPTRWSGPGGSVLRERGKGI